MENKIKSDLIKDSNLEIIKIPNKPYFDET